MTPEQKERIEYLRPLVAGKVERELLAHCDAQAQELRRKDEALRVAERELVVLGDDPNDPDHALDIVRAALSESDAQAQEVERLRHTCSACGHYGGPLTTSHAPGNHTCCAYWEGVRGENARLREALARVQALADRVRPTMTGKFLAAEIDAALSPSPEPTPRVTPEDFEHLDRLEAQAREGIAREAAANSELDGLLAEPTPQPSAQLQSPFIACAAPREPEPDRIQPPAEPQKQPERTWTRKQVEAALSTLKSPYAHAAWWDAFWKALEVT